MEAASAIDRPWLTTPRIRPPKATALSPADVPSTGAREPRVIYRHGLRNALLPLSTGLGLSILATLSGSVAVELVFNRPGIGRLLIEAISERDYPVIQAGVVIFAFFVVLVNLLMELVYVLVDPRIRVS